MKKFFLLFTFLLTFLATAKPIHPYHVGSVEINYNAKTKTFEISAKFFLDDLENSHEAAKAKCGVIVGGNPFGGSKPPNAELSLLSPMQLKYESKPP